MYPANCEEESLGGGGGGGMAHQIVSFQSCLGQLTSIVECPMYLNAIDCCILSSND